MSWITFHKLATNYRALLQKMIYKDKASFESSPPCMCRESFIHHTVGHESFVHPTVHQESFIYYCMWPYMSQFVYTVFSMFKFVGTLCDMCHALFMYYTVGHALLIYYTVHQYIIPYDNIRHIRLYIMRYVSESLPWEWGLEGQLQVARSYQILK